jgi:hypothetical protein
MVRTYSSTIKKSVVLEILETELKLQAYLRSVGVPISDWHKWWLADIYKQLGIYN